MQRLAAIVPTLDEERALPGGLASLAPHVDEIVVSDGGSRDRTVEIARGVGAEVVCGDPGRGPQLNRGAAATEADLLLFVHADTRLPANGIAALRTAVDRGAVGGGFRLRFDDERVIYRLAARLINLRTRLSGLPLGDQAHFATRQAFDAIGGYPPWPILEDLDFARRLRRHGPTTVLPVAVTTAARRYARGGFARTVATNWLIWSLFACGVSPERLARLYHAIR